MKGRVDGVGGFFLDHVRVAAARAVPLAVPLVGAAVMTCTLVALTGLWGLVCVERLKIRDFSSVL